MSDAEDAEEWAHIFNEFGEPQTRSMLLNAAIALDDDSQERYVVEIRDGDDGEYNAMEITDHVAELEESQ